MKKMTFEKIVQEHPSNQLLSLELLATMAAAEVDIPPTQVERVTRSLRVAIPQIHSLFAFAEQGSEWNCLDASERFYPPDAECALLLDWASAHGISEQAVEGLRNCRNSAVNENAFYAAAAVFDEAFETFGGIRAEREGKSLSRRINVTAVAAERCIRKVICRAIDAAKLEKQHARGEIVKSQLDQVIVDYSENREDSEGLDFLGILKISVPAVIAVMLLESELSPDRIASKLKSDNVALIVAVQRVRTLIPYLRLFESKDPDHVHCPASKIRAKISPF